jgi:hypothetical protein
MRLPLILLAVGLLTGCPAAFAPTNPVAANRTDAAPGNTDTEVTEAPVTTTDPSGAPAGTPPPSAPGVFDGGGAGTDVASNTPSGAIAAAADTAEAGKERLTITFRQVRYGHNMKGVLPEPPQSAYLSANPNGTTDLNLVIAYLNAGSNLYKGYPVNTQIRLIYYPTVLSQPTTYVDGVTSETELPKQDPNFTVTGLALGKGRLEIYAFEEPVYDATGSYTMAHTPDFQTGGLIPFATPEQMTAFIDDLHVHLLGSFDVIFGYPTGQPH